MEQRSMESTKKDPKAQRQKKFLLMLPVLVIPFLTGAFWALGGGKGNAAQAQQASVQHGFNMNLPAAHFDKKATILDKLGFYQKAELDSTKLAEKERSDPYLAVRPIITQQQGASAFNVALGRGKENGLYSKEPALNTYADPNEEKVFQRLDQLKKIISQPPPAALPTGTEGLPVTSYLPTQLPASSGIDRLEKLMKALKQAGDSTGNDPQIDKLNGVLDKVLKIQHPEMLTRPENSPAPATKTVTTPKPILNPDTGTVNVLGPAGQQKADTGGALAPDAQEGFVDFDDNSPADAQGENTIRAVISEDQTLVSGATIKLRLTEDALVNGVTLAKDNFVYGTATLSNERLLINIKSVINDHSIYPVNWQVFDLDGMTGIFIPGAIGRDVSKESAAEGINGVGITGLDASLGAQAANAGIQAAKTLFSKKIKLVRVSVKAGYEVLLKESKTAS